MLLCGVENGPHALVGSARAQTDGLGDLVDRPAVTLVTVVARGGSIRKGLTALHALPRPLSDVRFDPTADDRQLCRRQPPPDLVRGDRVDALVTLPLADADHLGRTFDPQLLGNLHPSKPVDDMPALVHVHRSEDP